MEMTLTDSTPQAERRHNLELRAVFDQACALIEPLLAQSQGSGWAASDFLICNVLRQAYPDLGRGDLQTLLVAAKRAHHARHRRDAKPVARPSAPASVA